MMQRRGVLDLTKFKEGRLSRDLNGGRETAAP
jgi:hypothetical protein